MFTIIAHRGASGVAPENTLPAFQIAARSGADAVEFDVQLSSDGVPVVYHDDSLNRCTNVRYKFPDRSPWSLADFTANELSILDAAFAFTQELEKSKSGGSSIMARVRTDEWEKWITPEDRALYGSGEVGIPTLAESLATCRALNLQAYIELKSIPRMWPNLPAAVVHEIKEQQMESSCIISSFDHQHLAQVRELESDLRIAVLSADRLYRPERYLRQLGAQAYNPGCYGNFDTIGLSNDSAPLDVSTIRKLRENGFEVNVWTSNDEEDVAILIKAGVSGIFTDFPSRLAKMAVTQSD